MQYTKIAADAFETMSLNAGIVVDGFTPSTGVIGNILGATTGGVKFAANPEYVDFGEDVDNVPANTMQLKRIKSYDPSLSGTFVTVTAALAGKLIGGATVSSNQIVPASQLTESHFADVWWIGDYSDKNTGAANAGYVAIHIMNALNTVGLQIQSTKDGKTQFPFEFHGHYDIDDIDEVPFEAYVKAGTTASSG